DLGLQRSDITVDAVQRSARAWRAENTGILQGTDANQRNDGADEAGGDTVRDAALRLDGSGGEAICRIGTFGRCRLAGRIIEAVTGVLRPLGLFGGCRTRCLVLFPR